MKGKPQKRKLRRELYVTYKEILSKLVHQKCKEILKQGHSTQCFRNWGDHDIFESMVIWKQQIIFILFSKFSNNLNFWLINCLKLTKTYYIRPHLVWNYTLYIYVLYVYCHMYHMYYLLRIGIKIKKLKLTIAWFCLTHDSAR